MEVASRGSVVVLTVPPALRIPPHSDTQGSLNSNVSYTSDDLLQQELIKCSEYLRR